MKGFEPERAPGLPCPLSGLKRAVFGGLAASWLSCGRPAPPPLPVLSSSPVVAPTPTPGWTAALSAWLAKPHLHFAPSALARQMLSKIYPTAAATPLWLDTYLRPTRSALDALAILDDAAAEGLDPSDYRSAELGALGRKLRAESPDAVFEAAAFETSLSLAMLRYLSHLHRGRVDPRAIGFHINLPTDEHDYAAILADAVRKERLGEAILAMTPPLVQYRSLRSVLPRYRALTLTEGTALPLLGDPPRQSIKAGSTAENLSLVRARLIALGDLRADSPPLGDPPLYEGELVEGVKRFQARHGYEADGILGRATWAALAVPLKWRVRQIELAMERLRWLPHLGQSAFLAVNVPMFRLFGWDRVGETGAPAFDMGVIVGKALDTQTPVFLADLKYVTFLPYWNVPRSILENEILPILRRDLTYLARQDMEMVEGQGDDAKPVAPTSQNVDLLAQGRLRLRQRPGPGNSLGRVMFMLPNDQSVYLHGTPVPELFGRARRDFSHGCIRVEDPLALAAWALRDQPEWTREKILAAMKGRPSFRVPLTRPIPVVVYYVTAAVIPAENEVHFADDIYGHDLRLDKALRSRSTASGPS